MVIWHINLRHNFLKAKLDLWIIFAWLKYNAALMLNGYTNGHLEVGDHYELGPLDQLNLTQQKNRVELVSRVYSILICFNLIDLS